MIKLLDDMVNKVGGITNFFLLCILAHIIASAIMLLIASVFMLWCKVR